MATWPQPVQLNHKVPKRGGWQQKKPALSLLALFVPLGLKGSVQYSTGVKYANWDVPTAITSVTGQAVVVTTQPNIPPIYPETKSLSVPEIKPMLSQEPSDFIISSSLDSEAVSQPSVLSPEALVVNVSLIASTSTQSVHSSSCSVIPTVSFSSSPSSQCYGKGIFGGVFVYTYSEVSYNTSECGGT